MWPFDNSSANTDRSQELDNYGRLGKSADSLSSAGAGATGDATKYFTDLLSGNPATVAAAAEPTTSTISNETNQNKVQLSNFGNRSGGTNAASQELTEGADASTADAIAKARGGAAPALAQIGSGETGQGLQADSTLGAEAAENRKQSYEQHQNSLKDWGSFVSSFLLGS